MIKASLITQAAVIIARYESNPLARDLSLPSGFDPRSLEMAKRAVDVMEGADGGWFQSTSPFGQVVSQFFESLRSDSAFLSADARGLILPAPLRCAIGVVTSDASAFVVGEGSPEPINRLTLARRELSPVTISALTAVTEEVLKVPGGEPLIETQLKLAAGSMLDAWFHNAMTDSTTESITSAGSTAANFFSDCKTIIKHVFPAGTPINRGFWITDPLSAIGMATLTDTTGEPVLMMEIGANGGQLLGWPLFTSSAWPAGALTLFNGNRLVRGLDNGIGISASREAALEMSATPTNNAETATGTQLVSMFQSYAVAILMQMRVAAERASDEAVAEIVGLNL